jgi:hypothetical protein
VPPSPVGYDQERGLLFRASWIWLLESVVAWSWGVALMRMLKPAPADQVLGGQVVEVAALELTVV